MPKLYSYENNKFTANYSEWHDWFENRPVVFEGKPYENMATLIVAHVFPDAWAKVVQAGNGEIESANVSLIAEPVAWHSLFKNSSDSSSDGKKHFLTPSGWAYKKISVCGNKYTFTDKFDRGAFAWSMTLEHCQFGWLEGSAATIKSGLVDNEDIINKWYGLNIFNIDHMIPSHSIVTPTPAPADVESETPTNYSVIKVYERENPETKEIVSEGSYITTNAYSDLTVNEEEGWKIISVETVSPLIKTIGSNDVYEAVKGDTTTKQVYDPDSLPVSVTLSSAEPTLIVRYRATDPELPPVRLTGTHTVPEQRITQSFRDTLVNSLSFVKNKISKEGDDHHTYKDGCGDKDHKCPGHDCDYNYSADKKVTDSKYTIKVYDENMKKENLLYALSTGCDQYGATNNNARDSKFNAFYTSQDFNSDSNQRRYLSFNKDSATGLGGINFTYNVTRHKTDTLTLCSYSKDVQGYTDNKVELVNLYGMKVGNKPLGNLLKRV